MKKIFNGVKVFWEKIYGKIKNFCEKIKGDFARKRIEREQCKRRSKLTPTEKELYRKWKEKWNRLRKNKNEEEDIFLILYTEIYETCSYKAYMNKQKNKIFKFIFVLVLIIFFVGMLLSFVHKDLGEMDTFMSIAKSGAMFLLVIWGASIINKWIEIKKYQETWVRHSNHLFMLKKEMLKFIEEMEPYELYPKQTDEQRAVRFIQNILNIGETNQKRFSHNMNSKEKELMDVFNKMGLIKKKEENE